MTSLILIALKLYLSANQMFWLIIKLNHAVCRINIFSSFKCFLNVNSILYKSCMLLSSVILEY